MHTRMKAISRMEIVAGTRGSTAHATPNPHRAAISVAIVFGTGPLLIFRKTL